MYLWKRQSSYRAQRIIWQSELKSVRVQISMSEHRVRIQLMVTIATNSYQVTLLVLITNTSSEDPCHVNAMDEAINVIGKLAIVRYIFG